MRNINWKHQYVDSSLLWRASHHMAVVIPALDTGFKMCEWRVIVTDIGVISRPGVFMVYPSYRLFY